MKVAGALLLAVLVPGADAATPNPSALNEKLDRVRSQRLTVEKALLDAERAKKSTEDQLSRLKTLQKLQNQEKVLTEQRLATLEKYLLELQGRKAEVVRRLGEAKAALRIKISKLIHPLLMQNDQVIRGDEGEAKRRVREKILSSVASAELKELEGLKVDLQDAEDIESRIEQEKQQISSLMQDVSEQESLIRFHKKLREDLTLERHSEHLQQLEEYRKLKVSEVEIGRMISDFAGRRKLEEEQDQKKKQPVVTLRPKSLPWPLKGKLVGTYGQHRDPKSGLDIFSKGIEILTMHDHAPVECVMDGKVQFSGEIPGKGRVLIIEHPHSIYSIYGGLKETLRTGGEVVKASEQIGFLESDQPLYFEIRARNVAIDPVKWLQ
jgi:septal ring factor EnvC (AmiA/AmiB activator)